MQQYKKRKRKKRKILWGRVILLILVPVALVFGAIKAFQILTDDPYAQYQTYDEKTKLYGEMEFKDEENKEKLYYLAYRYPKFDDEEAKALNEALQAYEKNEINTEYKQKDMVYIKVDYDCEMIFNHYISVTMHQKAIDSNHKVLYTNSKSYNYDVKTKQLMDVTNVLRRDYIYMLEGICNKSNIKKDEIKVSNLNQFILRKKEVSFYFNGDTNKKITLPYTEYKQYIALTDSNIPSLHQSDAITRKPQPKVNKTKKLLAFTFDDGPSPRNTKAIMDEFEKYNGRATFFMLGQNMEYYPDLVKDVCKRGHEIGNHSYSHAEGIAASGTFSPRQVRDEVYIPNDTVFSLTGYEPKHFRPPFGAINDTLDSVCSMDMVSWDIDSEDWSNRNPDTMTQIILDQVKVGYNVILMHDIHDPTLEGVKKVLRILNDQGYQFVTIDTLMKYEAEYLTSYNQNRYNNVVIPSIVGK